MLGFAPQDVPEVRVSGESVRGVSWASARLWRPATPTRPAGPGLRVSGVR
jgi:hypothetical protein